MFYGISITDTRIIAPVLTFDTDGVWFANTVTLNPRLEERSLPAMEKEDARHIVNQNLLGFMEQFHA